ncbi:hypothetical protein EDD18DRAFT_1103061 [Armillaria luteobubalina]|uniref:Uncharacterized protein n=1 Tax=Armillaria luteobubalina TaxID=153913 RepID=A0AA39QDL1_9AGAR|nr:hypothetical protein EDD18DRAFT_1103061 [Armillaria luteobubalina]
MSKRVFTDKNVFTSTVKGLPSLLFQEPLVPDDAIQVGPPDIDLAPQTGPYVPVSIDNIPIPIQSTLPTATPDHAAKLLSRRKAKVDVMLGPAANQPEFIAQFMEQAEKFEAEIVKPAEAPSTVKAREYLEMCWVEFVQRVHTIKPRRVGRVYMKARTLFEFMTLFIHLIIRYTVDPATSRMCGMVLLTKFKVHSRMKDQTLSLIHHFNLDRYYDKKWYYGRAELQILIDTAMQSPSMRLVKINVILRALFAFYMTSRPSSMGPFCREYAALGYYLKLKNLRIYRQSHMVWTIAVNFRNYKGNNSFLGKEQTFYLELNLQQSLAELFACEQAELALDPANYEWAVFPAIQPGGRSFFSFKKAATSLAISASIGALCKMAGLAVVGGYAFRREAGDAFSLYFDERTARDIMAHEGESVFANHYSRGVEHINVVSVRMQETADKVLVERQAYLRAAVRSIIRQDADAKSDRDKSTSKRKTIMPEKEKLEVLDGNTEWIEANATLDSQWGIFYACFTSNAKKYLNPNIIYEIATGERQAGQKKHFTFAEGYDADNVLPILRKLQEDIKCVRKLRVTLGRRLTTEYVRARDHGDTVGTFPGTTAQRDAALKKSLQVSKFLQPIIQGVATTTTVDDSSPANPSSSSDPDPDTNDIDFDFGEFAQPEYTQHVFKLMHAMDKECPATSMLAEDVNADNFTPASNDINEENERNEVPVSVAEVREAMMIALMEPIETDHDIEKHYDKATKTWSCPKCPFYYHRPPALQEVKFESMVNFKRHMQRVHTEWKELELKMVSHWSRDDDVRYREYMCPCGYFSHRDQKEHHESLLRAHNKILHEEDTVDIHAPATAREAPQTTESLKDFSTMINALPKLPKQQRKMLSDLLDKGQEQLAESL